MEIKWYWGPKFKNFEDKAKSQIGEKLYNAFIKGYTIKQWGKSPKFLPESIFNRLPIRFNYNEDYYKNSICQGVPEGGYTSIFNKLIESNKIKIEFNSNWIKFKKINWIKINKKSSFQFKLII